ncbi:MAG TPA: amino acid adenylation domain-containing protein, partial [Longimicrobium sp.]
MQSTLTLTERERLLELARAARLERSWSQLSPIEPADRGARLPLSFAQQRLWFLEQLGALGSAYHIPGRLRLRGELDAGALARALERIVARHEALRTTFAAVDGEPEQRVAPAAGSRFHLAAHDLRGRAGADAELERLSAEEADAPFDLERGPLVRGRLVRLAKDDHVLLLTMHHIVADAWSMGVLVDELAALYGAYREGGDDPLPPLPVQYADYAAWQRRWVDGEVLRRQADYWTRTLAGAPELLELPADHPRPARQDHSGGAVRVELDEALTAGLKVLGRRHGATLFMTLLAGWATVLGRLSGQDDVVVGTPTANRGRKEVEGLVGLFVNTLALRVDLSDSPTVAGLLERVKARALEAQQNQDIPFEQVVELLRPARSLAHHPVFQVMFAWQSAPRASRELPGVELALMRGSRRVTAKFDLELRLGEAGGRVEGVVEYAASLFERATVERWAGYLRRVLEAMAAGDGRSVERLELLSDAERRQVVEEWNATAADYPRDVCVHELFEAQVERTPGAVALVCAGEALTYRELDARANRLARHLRGRGVGPETRVGICLPRTPDLVVSLLAVLKAGGAYVPLEPNYPRERLGFMLEDAEVETIVTTSELAGRLPEGGARALRLDVLRDEIARESDAAPGSGAAPGNLSHVIFTSGSTGRPKGVMIRHSSGVARLCWLRENVGDAERSAVLFSSSASFDVSFTEVFGALAWGGRLVVAENALALASLPEPVTYASMVPTAAAELLRTGGFPACVKVVLFAGETLPPEVVHALHALGTLERVVNLYGPTEDTTYSTSWPVPEGARHISIGRPMALTRAYVLDGELQPAPVGVAGDLYLAGEGLARGYARRPGLTAASFLPDPFGPPGSRVYRTLDRARWRGDGTLEFAGRADFQVKVRGFRIEPGEIESRLVEHPGVRAAVVVARGDTPADRRLVAYYVGDAVGADALRAHLAERLPEYMVPAAFVALERLPVTPNGKLDRRALPDPGADAYARRGYEAPVGEVETALAEVWSEVLGVERVGRRDHFFELGGHSLLAVRLAERMRRRGLYAEVAALFATPTLAELAAAVGGAPREVRAPANGIPTPCDAVTPEMLPLVELSQAEIDRVAAGVAGGAANVQDVYPLAPLQEGILFHHLAAAEGDPYLMAGLYGFDDRARLDAWLAALRAVVARHDVLRTSVAWEGLREPVQVVWREAPLRVEEVELDPAGGDAAEQLYRRFDPRRHRIDVRRAPLLRLHVARDEARGRWLLLLLLHHLCSDHASLEVLQEEVRAHLEGRADLLPAPPPFRDYVAQARLGVGRGEHEAFFRELLGGVEEPTAPFGLLDAWGDGSGIAEAALAVDPALAARLGERARALGVSAAAVCHVAWAQVLARASGRGDVVFGTVLFGRMSGGAGSDRALGPFINTLPVRVRVASQGVEAAVLGTHRQLAELLRHEHASLALAQRCSGVAAPAPLFTALLNYRHSRRPGEAGASGMRGLRANARTNYPLTLAVDDLGDGLALRAFAPATVGPERVCAMVHRALEGVVEALEAEPGRALSRVDVLPEPERRRVVEEWNATDAPRPDACLHELFEAQVERTPDAAALTFEDQTLTYAELNARANRLAHHLRGRGVGPDVRVGLCVERSLEMMVGLLGVLKAGGAYVALDPEYPEERLRYMLVDSEPALLLTHGSAAERLGGLGVPVVALGRDASSWADRPATNPGRGGLTPHHLVYVIYTSGSTGRPKGVMVEHRSAANALGWMQQAWRLGPGDAVLQKTPYSFDASLRELLLTLLAGARLVLARPGGQRDPAYLVETVRREGVTVLHFVPSFLQVLAQEPGFAGCAALKRVVCGGEPLAPELVR